MSADLNTFIRIKGAPEELFLLLEVLKKFEKDNYEQYGKGRDCAYIEWVEIKVGSHMQKLEALDDDGIRGFIADHPGEIEVEASGPYGVFGELGEVGLFEEMASAAPTAYFDGVSSGFVTGADVSLRGVLEEGLLQLTEFYMTDEARSEAYVQAIKQWLPYPEFCSLFEVDQDSFDDDPWLNHLYRYSDLISKAIDSGFPNMDYKKFIEHWSSYGIVSEISEEKYNEAIEKVQKIGLVDFDTFMMEFDDSEFNTQTVYDPVTKEYREQK